MTTPRALLLLVSLLLTSGCRAVGLTRSGFLGDYGGLERDEGERARETFVTPDVAWARYHTALLEPLALRLQETSLDDLSPRQERTLRDHYRGFLERELPRGMELADRPGPGVVIVRSALTEVDTCNVPLNWITGLGILWPVDTGGATLEVEVIDAESGEQLAALVNADKATLWNALAAMTAIGHACQALEETAAWVGDTVAGEPEVRE